MNSRWTMAATAALLHEIYASDDFTKQLAVGNAGPNRAADAIGCKCRSKRLVYNDYARRWLAPWAYKGHPLCNLSGDAKAGDANGDGWHLNGGIWHVARP